jgi:hypothetical protein
MKKSFINIVSMSLIALCLVCEMKSQTKAPNHTTTPHTSPAPKQDLSNWQTAHLEEKGIKFKLPPDWRHDDSDMKSEKENFTIEALEWNTTTQEMIRLFITTHHKGFVSLAGKAASSEERVAEKFQSVTKAAKDDSSISDVKRFNLSGVEGVFRIMNLNLTVEDGGARRGILWTGYRVYQGKGQEVDISLSGNLKSEEILRTIFSTFEFVFESRSNWQEAQRGCRGGTPWPPLAQVPRPSKDL